MLSKKMGSAVAWSLIMAFVLAGCSAKQPASTDSKSGPEKNKVIKLGTLSPLSGEQASAGESLKMGATFAVTEMQEQFTKAGFDLKLVSEDDQANKDAAVIAGQKLLKDTEIIGVVGTWNSGTALPVSELFAKENLTLISPGNSNPQLTERGLKNYFRIVSRDDVQMPSAVAYAVKTFKPKSVLIAHDQDAYGQGAAEQFKGALTKANVTIAGTIGVDTKATAFANVVAEVQKNKPDIVLLGSVYNTGSLMIKQLREAGFTGPIIGGDGMDFSEAVRLGGKQIVGAYYTSIFADLKATTAGKTWAEKYKAKYTKDPEPLAAYAYDAAMVLLGAMLSESKNGQVATRQQVATAVAKTTGYQGVATRISFDQKGDNKDAKIYIWQFKEEKYPGSLIGAAD